MKKIKKLNKKAIEYNAGMMLIYVITYFLFFIFVLTTVEGFEDTLYANYTKMQCDYPQLIYDAETQTAVVYNPLDKKESKIFTTSGEWVLTSVLRPVSYLNDYSKLKCEHSKGVLSSNLCNSINGCNWVNTTKFIWSSFTYKNVVYCNGTINSSYYGVDSESNIFGTKIKLFNNSDLNLKDSKYICLHPNLNIDKTICETFSCSWSQKTKTVESSLYHDKISYVDMAEQLVNFEYDFNTGNDGIDTILYVIFIIIPFLLIGICTYLLIPFF